jgi:hypothetical protein
MLSRAAATSNSNEEEDSNEGAAPFDDSDNSESSSGTEFPSTPVLSLNPLPKYYTRKHTKMIQRAANAILPSQGTFNRSDFELTPDDRIILIQLLVRNQ